MFVFPFSLLFYSLYYWDSHEDASWRGNFLMHVGESLSSISRLADNFTELTLFWKICREHMCNILKNIFPRSINIFSINIFLTLHPHGRRHVTENTLRFLRKRFSYASTEMTLKRIEFLLNDRLYLFLKARSSSQEFRDIYFQIPNVRQPFISSHSALKLVHTSGGLP